MKFNPFLLTQISEYFPYLLPELAIDAPVAIFGDKYNMVFAVPPYM